MNTWHNVSHPLKHQIDLKIREGGGGGGGGGGRKYLILVVVFT